MSMLLTCMLSHGAGRGGLAASWPSIGRTCLMIEKHSAVILIRSWRGRITQHTVTAQAARS